MASPRSYRTPYKGPKTFALADLTAKAMDPVLAKQGFGAADIILNWEDIVGERLARYCEPVKLQWPARPAKGEPGMGQEPASLVVRVEGGFAIELQHVSPLVIERVNAHLGWRCIGRLLLRQGDVLRGGASRATPRTVPDPYSLADPCGAYARPHPIDDAHTVAVRRDAGEGQDAASQAGTGLHVGRVDAGPLQPDAYLTRGRFRVGQRADLQYLAGGAGSFVEGTEHARSLSSCEAKPTCGLGRT
jgi:hypothetical protein